jgi:hypothetical protein
MSRVWGRQSPTVSREGKTADADFGHRVETALRDCKLSLTSVRHFFGKLQPQKFVSLFSAITNPVKGIPARFR